jgi:predicted CXXCH cytochrome family protein
MFISLSMKKTIPAAGAILFFLFSQIAWSGNFIESPHDFRKNPENRSGEICLPCHVMQGTKTLSGPLWNLSSPTQTYIMYGQTFLSTKESVMKSLPDGISKKCLSCHDGVIAPDAYGPNTGDLAFHSDEGFMGIIPNNNHPISFIYDTALATKYGDLYDPSAKPSGVAGSIEIINDPSARLLDVTDSSRTINDPSTTPSDVADTSGTINADMLFSNRMECASCHDVHNTKAVPGTKLLVKDIAGSTLCLTCHNK